MPRFLCFRYKCLDLGINVSVELSFELISSSFKKDENLVIFNLDDFREALQDLFPFGTTIARLHGGSWLRCDVPSVFFFNLMQFGFTFLLFEAAVALPVADLSFCYLHYCFGDFSQGGR